MLARPTSFERSTLSELWRVENFRCSNGSGMLIDDPLGEGSNASSTNSELWRAENSFSEMRRNSNAQEWDPRYKPGPDQLK